MEREAARAPWKDRRLLGTVAGLAAALCFAGMNVAVLHSGGELRASASLASRGGVGALVLLPWAWREVRGALGRQGWSLWLQCLGGALAALCLFHNVNALSVGQAIALSYLAPVFVAMLAPVVYHERLGLAQGAGIVVMVAGASALQATYTDRPTMQALGIGVFGALCGAVAMMALKRAARAYSPQTACWAFCLCSVVTALLLDARGTLGDIEREWVLGLQVGVLGTVGQLLLSYSFLLLPASVAGGISLTTLLFSVLWASIFTTHWPAPLQWVAYAILCVGLLLLQMQRPHGRAAAQPRHATRS